MKIRYLAVLLALYTCGVSPAHANPQGAAAPTKVDAQNSSAVPQRSDEFWSFDDANQSPTAITAAASDQSGSDRGLPSTKVTYPKWHQLKDPQQLSPLDQNPAFHYRFKADNGSNVDLIVTELNSPTWQLKPSLVDSVAVTAAKGEQDGATVIVNGGYFNMKDRDSISYVVVDGKMVLDPGRREQF